MRNNEPDPDAWWSERSPDEKRFFRAVVLMAEDLLDGEVLKLSFNGQSFTPVLFSKREPATQPGRAAGKTTPDQNDDEWWAVISSLERTLTRELAKLIKELQHDCDKALEMTNTAEKFTASLVLNFKKPTGGRAATN